VSAPTLNPDWAMLPLFDRSSSQRLRFGEFAQSINERVNPGEAAQDIYVGLEHLDPQSLHIRRWGKGSDVIGTKLRFRKGDVIFGRRRAYQRKLAVAEFDGICSAHAMVVRAKPDVVLQEFLPFLMMSDCFMNRAVEISVGSLSPTINWTTLKLEEFALPPLVHQRRIAEILWEIEKAIVSWEQAQRNLNILNNAFLHANLVKRKDGQLPDGGKVQALNEITEIISDGEHLSPKFLGSGVPILSAKDVWEEGVQFSKARYISPEAAELSWRRCRPAYGDILVVSRGATIGRSTSVNTEKPFALMGSVIQVRANERLVLSEFLAQFLRLPSSKRQLLATSGSTAQQAIYLADIKELKVVVPRLQEQKSVCETVRTHLDQMKLVAREIEVIRSLRSAFLRLVE